MSNTRNENAASQPRGGAAPRWRRLAMAMGLALTLNALPGSAQICGDCDSDGRVTVADALLMNQHAVGLTTITGPRLMECDVNSTGTVDILDVLTVVRVSIGLPPPMPLNCPVCGDCNLNGTANDIGDVLVIPIIGSVPVTTSGQAACDTDGDLDLDAADRMRFTMVPRPYSCSTCGDCDQDGDVDVNDPTRAVSFPPVPSGRASASCDIAGTTPGQTVIDALLIGNYVAMPAVGLACTNPTALPPP